MMISGERFIVTYLVSGSEQEALAKAKDICIEQTVEFPPYLIPAGFIQDEILGRIESFEAHNQDYKVRISYAVETTANELTQLLNVIFGNISIKPGIRVEHLEFPPALLRNYKGPRFGKEGIRTLLGITERPVLFTALKPMGLSAEQLADLAYKFALGGIDVIKDDHGLTDQCFAPFAERVHLCAAAVDKANKETGSRSIYVANITAPYGQVSKRARVAKEFGAGGLMVAPALVGFDCMRELAENDDIALPLFSHPAFIGSYVTYSQNGLSHQALFGQVMRLAGADVVIYPNFGGRFSFSQTECEAIARAAAAPMAGIKEILPAPGGGMSIQRVPELHAVYGNDVMFLIGGGLFQHGPDIVENCRYFRSMLNSMDQYRKEG